MNNLTKKTKMEPIATTKKPRRTKQAKTFLKWLTLLDDCEYGRMVDPGMVAWLFSGTSGKTTVAEFVDELREVAEAFAEFVSSEMLSDEATVDDLENLLTASA
jgi:hypothetical protein